MSTISVHALAPAQPCRFAIVEPDGISATGLRSTDVADVLVRRGLSAAQAVTVIDLAVAAFPHRHDVTV